jgi:uncharacterized membrane protein (UPF0136 family)
MRNAVIGTVIYIILLLAGGLVGFFVANSIPSLVMSSVFSALLAFFAWGMAKNCNYSRIAAMALVGLILAFFAYRFALTMQFMPAGLMILLSIGLLILLFRSKKTPS